MAFRLLPLALLATLTASGTAAQSFQRLGFGLPTATTSVATGLSDDGQVVIGTNGAAFVWSAAAGFRYLPDAAGNSFVSQVRGVNRDGTRVVGWTTASNIDQAAVWALADSVYVHGALSGVDASAYGLSADGTVTVGTQEGEFDAGHPGRENRPVRWLNGALEPLASFGFPTGVARAVSRDGTTAVGTVSGALGASLAARWGQDGAQTLGTLPGGTMSQANAVDGTGATVVGWSTGASGGREAFRWNAEAGMVGLGFPMGYSTSDALAVSADGSVVGGQLNNFFAAVWTEEAGWRTLSSMLEGAGLTDEIAGFRLLAVTAISADGQTFAGSGLNESNQTEAFVAFLPTHPSIVVNVSSDEPIDPASRTAGRCDVDRDETGDQCTLRAAIELANDRGGATITFDIPGSGVPSIQVTDYTEVAGSPFADGLPTFQSRIILDATTQPGGWVELTGTGTRGVRSGTVADAIRIGADADESEVRGLVINRFVGSLIHLLPGADRCIIEGNRLGTDVSGTLSMGTPPLFAIDYTNTSYPWEQDPAYPISGGVHIESNDAQVQDNVIAGNANSFPSLTNEGPNFGGGIDLLLGPSSRRALIRRNRIGVGAGGAEVTVSTDATTTCCTTEYIGVFVQGADHQIGGDGGDGNTLSGHSREILARAPSGHEIVGNAIGPQTGRSFQFGRNVGVLVYSPDDPLGAPDAPAGGVVVQGNAILARNEAVAVGGPAHIVGNQLEGFVGGSTSPPTNGQSFFHQDAAVTMGSNVHLIDNQIKAAGWAVVIEGAENVVSDNRILDVYGGIRIANRADDTSTALLSRNTVASRQMGIELDGGAGDLSEQDGVTVNDVTDLDEGPNGLLNYPVLLQASRSGGTVQVEGFVQGLASGAYEVEVFGNASCSGARRGGIPYGAGQSYLGTVSVALGPTDLGEAPFSFLAGGLGGEPLSITLTSSRPALFATSEFGHCLPAVDADQVASAPVGPGQTGLVFDGLGASVSTSTASGRISRSNDGGTLYVTRYTTSPTPGVFADRDATAPNGASVRPDAVASRSWLLTDRGLTPEGGAETGATFRICLDPTGAVFPDQVDAVVLVRRSEETDGAWVSSATTRETNGPSQGLCADGLTTLGEFGFGGAEGAFPVGSQEGRADGGATALSLAVSPNPSAGHTTVRVTMPEPGAVRVELYDALGRVVARLVDGDQPAGGRTLVLDTGRLAPGVYVIRAMAGGEVATRTLTVVR